MAKQFDVQADGPNGIAVSVGPVHSAEAVTALAAEIVAAGWTPVGVRVRLSRTAFREFVKTSEADRG